MSANPIDKNSTPKTTGSLEDLFRHHLGEEAAVPPRPMLWDHIDNSLLVRQNETYRRRLVATRWVAAASLGLATLAGTGWWAQSGSGLVGPEVATRGTATAPAGGSAAGQGSASVATAGEVGAGSAGASQAAYGDEDASQAAKKARGASEVASSSAQVGRAVRSQTNPRAAAVRAGLENGTMPGTTSSNDVASAGTTGGSLMGRTAGQETAGDNKAVLASATVPASGSQAQSLIGTENPAVGTTGTTAADVATAADPGNSGELPATSLPTLAASYVPAASAVLPGQVGLLAPTATALALTAPAALPNGLAAISLPAETAPVLAATEHKWQYGASYAAGAFNPNINFSREGLGSEYAYNPALGADSPALTEAAATEYRNNLRPGLSQRIALVAKRHLTGNWSLNTGAEFAQATAKSASTSAFVGEQLLDLGQFSTGAMRTTSFRYRTAGIPVSLSYNNAEKRGWSVYGRLGGVVSALLGVRSEVEGSPEATRTYSLASAGTPYRRVLGSIRGAAGAQYRSELGGWGFTLAPTAELGLMPLNANPAQSLFAQSRPYTFGVEASVEFGR